MDEPASRQGRRVRAQPQSARAPILPAVPKAKSSDDEDKPGTAADFDRPLDVEQAFLNRQNGGAGHGTLRDNRAGFVRLRRKGWDDLRALADAGELTDHQVFMTVALLTRSGFRPDRMGVVLGTDRELARVLGMHYNRVKGLWLALESLGIGERLVTDSGDRAGWRFTRQAWQWLAGEQDYPPPRQVATALASEPSPAPERPADDFPDPFG